MTIATDLLFLEILSDPLTITTAESQRAKSLDASLDSTTPEVVELFRHQRIAAVEVRRRVQQWCVEDLFDNRSDVNWEENLRA